MASPWLVIVVFGGTILWGSWVILRDRRWTYASEPLAHRVGYLVLFAAGMVGAAVWLLTQ